MRSRRDQCHCIGPAPIDSGRLAHWRTPHAELRGANHTRHTKSGPAMHRLQLPDEIGGNRAKHVGLRFANVWLPAVQTDSATRHRKRRDRGLVSAEEEVRTTGSGCPKIDRFLPAIFQRQSTLVAQSVPKRRCCFPGSRPGHPVMITARSSARTAGAFIR